MKSYKFESWYDDTNNKWFIRCTSHEHFPLIEKTKDGKYKQRNSNGKTIIHDEYLDAIKLAKETYKKFSKLNKTWED